MVFWLRILFYAPCDCKTCILLIGPRRMKQPWSNSTFLSLWRNSEDKRSRRTGTRKSSWRCSCPNKEIAHSMSGHTRCRLVTPSCVGARITLRTICFAKPSRTIWTRVSSYASGDLRSRPLYCFEIGSRRSMLRTSLYPGNGRR